MTGGVDKEFDRTEYEYNRVGQITRMKDANETEHEYAYDELGRLLDDKVTAFGSGVATTVKRLNTTYNLQGRVATKSSYDAASGGNVLDQVAFEYDGFGQLTKDKQEHDGAVDGSTPEVAYAYEDGTDNTARRTTMTYPDGRQVETNYGSAGSIDDLMSRVASLKVNGESTDLVDYTFVGAGRYVKIQYPEPGVELTYIQPSGSPLGDAGDQYTGYDRFGRTVDMRWVMTSGGAVRDRFEYGYDRASNRTWRNNLAADDGEGYEAECYAYDGLYQVTGHTRGNLNINRTAIAAIPAAEESFTYDPTGNWLRYLAAADGAETEDQSRTNNRDNQITQIDGESDHVLYDAVGNALEMPPRVGGDWDHAYQFTWDAWNRLVEIFYEEEDTVTQVAIYRYDARSYRITAEVLDESTSQTETTHSYFSDRWKPIEERIDTSSDPSRQYLWGARPNHRDELIRRDRDTTGNGTLDERLYCLMDYFNATSIVDTSGDVQERYGYSAFGVRRIMAPDFSDRSTSSFDWNFNFQGQFLDLESGFYNYGYRYYSPELGKWLSRDPIKERGGVNLYGFIGNNVENLVDRFGLYEIYGFVGLPGIHVVLEDCEVFLITGHGDESVQNTAEHVPGSSGCGAYVGQDTCGNVPSQMGFPSGIVMGILPHENNDRSSLDSEANHDTENQIDKKVSMLCGCCSEVLVVRYWVTSDYLTHGADVSDRNSNGDIILEGADEEIVNCSP